MSYTPPTGSGGVGSVAYAQTLVVAKSGGDYATIGAALSAITDAASSKRYCIRIMPGLYTEQVTCKDWVDIVGCSRHAVQVQFTGNANGTFILANSIQIENILVEMTNTEGEWAFVGTNKSQVHLRHVDVLAVHGGSARSSVLKMTGATWATLFLEDCVFNLQSRTNYGIDLTGSAQNIDCTFFNVFLDSFFVTTGGGLRLSNVQDIQIRDGFFRTAAAGFNIRLESGAKLDLWDSWLEFGTSALEVDGSGSAVRVSNSTIDSVALTSSGTIAGAWEDVDGSKQTRTGWMDLAELGSAPATPASGYGSFYVKTDGKPYFKNDSGTESDLTATGSLSHNILSATHTDVDSTDTPADKEVLTWDATAGKWVSAPLLGALAIHAYHSANQSIANNTATPLLFDSERADTVGGHFTSAANLTGTVSKTSASSTLTGSGTAFLTELTVGQVIDVPGTATERKVVTAIATNTSLTVNSSFANSASGQTATRVNSAVVCLPGYAGRWEFQAVVAWAASATGRRVAALRVNGSTIIAQVDVVPPDASAFVMPPVVGSYDLNDWDYVEVVVTQVSGGALNATVVGNYACEFKARAIGKISSEVWNISTVYASRPSAGTVGRLFLPTDAPVIQRDNGTAYETRAPSYPFTTPILTDFAWINQGGSTITDQGWSLHLRTPADTSGANIRIRKKTAPATPYTITAFLEPLAIVKNFHSCGIGWRQSSDGKLVLASLVNHGLFVSKYGSATSFTADYISGGLGFLSPLAWVRIEDDGTNRKVHLSRNGVNWVQVHSIGRTDFLTADEVLFFAAGENAATPNIEGGMTLYSWKQA